ncbi:prostate stem cell antigen-like isoform X2 [Amblyraja radiata]|uniref:prostate stem cell antigen-like isoform X2 n=1 Tax=Amblyraja radiata TaxID=386614 RepID=UPI0014042114|nr:prostate stem cell antigen-like isoform X2 [Amblyraja radiata]
MNYLVVLVAGLILSASPGNTLECYSCSGSTERCVTDTVNCTAGQQCFLLVAEASGVKAYGAGCVRPADCNVQQTVPGASVSVSCCDTDLCNASDQVK